MRHYRHSTCGSDFAIPRAIALVFIGALFITTHVHASSTPHISHVSDHYDDDSSSYSKGILLEGDEQGQDQDRVDNTLAAATSHQYAAEYGSDYNTWASFRTIANALDFRLTTATSYVLPSPPSSIDLLLSRTTSAEPYVFNLTMSRTIRVNVTSAINIAVDPPSMLNKTGALSFFVTTTDHNPESTYIEWINAPNNENDVLSMLHHIDTLVESNHTTTSPTFVLSADHPSASIRWKSGNVGPVLFEFTINNTKDYQEPKPKEIDIVHYIGLKVLSDILGWAYFVAWILSFLPQIWTNFRRKSVVGLDFNFVILNFIGFACYFAYYALFFFDPWVGQEYHDTEDPGDLPVDLPDLTYASFALFCTIVVGLQCIFLDRGSQKVSKFCVILVALILVAIIVLGALVAVDKLSILKFAEALSYIKVGITLCKWVPQLWINVKRKSTVGFNIGAMILDLIGGVLSFAQQLAEGSNTGDWYLLFGNVAKTILAIHSFVFDIIFLVQRYGLYPKASKKDMEERERIRLHKRQEKLRKKREADAAEDDATIQNGENDDDEAALINGGDGVGAAA